MITKELIWKFFQNDCTPEEKDLVARYLEENPGAVEEYLGEEDWESFATSRNLDPSISKRLFNRLEREYSQHYAAGRLLKKFAAAACIILLAGIGWKVLLHRQAKSDIPAFALKLDSTDLADPIRHTRNLTGEKMTIALKDGSLIELYPASEVSFREEMKSQREFHLQGKAYFKVASDINRPFVVYSDELSTTVLGTSFTVTAFEEDNTIKVGLHTGKVLVRLGSTGGTQSGSTGGTQSGSTGGTQIKLSGGISLSPGELLVYDKKSRVTKVLSPSNRLNGRKNRANSVGLPEWYMFSGQPLEQVFDQLSVYYDVEIGYSPADIKNRYFTGRYENSDSLDEILKDIALLNRLSITKQDGRYIVKKQIHR
jgi:transmembrane sensor